MHKSDGAADIVIRNAAVLTMDPDRPHARAVAIACDRIVALDADAEKMQAARTVDAGGDTLLPGFFESHCHLFLGGAELDDLALSGVTGFDEVAERVRAHAAAHPVRVLLTAQGADYAIFGRAATRHDLDRILPDRPFAMTSGDHHTVWANTAALRAAGLLDGRTLPPGAEVVMGADGLATGELREPPAFGAVMALAGMARATLGLSTGEEPDPPPTPAERAADRDILARAAAHLARHGITSAVNMDGNRYTLELLQELDIAGRLPVRVQVAFHFKPHMDLAALDRAEALARDFQGDRLRGGLVKMFMDGVIEGGTAWTLQDYPGRPGWRGEPLFAPARFAQIAAEADRRGLQIAVHAIGDAAVRATIDGLATARAANGARDSRHRIEHIELIDPSDVPRLAALGITASVQPPHPPGAMDMPLEPTLSMIPAARLPDAYRWRTLGAPLVFASDWPVADVSVLRGIKAALTRRPWPVDPTGDLARDLPDERIGLMPTLAAYTRAGAWASHCETARGTIRSGMLADLVLLGGNIVATPPKRVDDLGVAMTICGGRITHESGR